jgi:hypothetical protein
VNWVQIARVTYTETRSLAEREFIEAERAIGAGRARILFRHILPHLVPTIIVWGTLGISTTVLLEATLSYLGIGVQPPTASGATSSSRTRPISRRTLAGVLPRRGDPGAGARLQSRRRRACATSSTRRSGAGHDRLSLPPPRPGRLHPARRVASSPSCSSISCRPTRCARSPAAAQPRRRSRTSAASSGLDQPFTSSTGAICALVSGDLGRSYHPAAEVSD